MIVLVAAGPAVTIQDAGRFGLLRFGVTPAGPMDPPAYATANLALGNAADAAAVEIGPGGLALTCDAPLPLAFAGGGFRWTRDAQALPAAARVTLRPGETLRVRAGAWGQWCYLAVPGGLDVPPVMGSRATHTRSGLGGLQGRTLVAGDRLTPARHASAPLDDNTIQSSWLAPDDAPLRVVLGPQDDHFTAAAIETLLRATWTLSAAADRMAYALEGPRLEHARGHDIVSDGVALGAVQVAGTGQPTVLMADRQPTGGYPKIAHVCRADLGRLAQLRPGQFCRFAATSVGEARDASLALDALVRSVPRQLLPLRQTPPAERLAVDNLIGGVTNGME